MNSGQFHSKPYTGIHCNFTPYKQDPVEPQTCEILLDGVKEKFLRLSEASKYFILRSTIMDPDTNQPITLHKRIPFPSSDRPSLYFSHDLTPSLLHSPANEKTSYRWSSLPQSSSLVSFCSLYNCISLPLPSTPPHSFQLIPFSPSSPSTDTPPLLYIKNLPYTIQFLYSPLSSPPPHLSSPLQSPPSSLPFFFYITPKDESTYFKSFITPEGPQGAVLPGSDLQVFRGEEIAPEKNVLGTLMVFHKAFQQQSRMSVILRTVTHQYSVAVGYVEEEKQWRMGLESLTGVGERSMGWLEGGEEEELVSGGSGFVVSTYLARMKGKKEEKEVMRSDKGIQCDGEGVDNIGLQEKVGEKSFLKDHGGKVGCFAFVVLVVMALVLYKFKGRLYKKEVLIHSEEEENTQEQTLA